MKSLSRLVAPVLVGTALASLAIVATVSYVTTADLDERQSLEQLEELQQSRLQAIADGLERNRRSVTLLATDRAVATALVDLRDGVAALEAAADAGTALLDDDEEAALRSTYEALAADEGIRRSLVAAGLDVPTAAELVPVDPVARFLQHEYLAVGPPRATAPQREPAPGDPGASYRAAHDRHRDLLRRATANLGFGDLLLVDLDDRIVHTVTGGPELGVVVGARTVGDGGLADLLRDELRRVAVGEVAVIDLQPTLGTAGRPAAYMATAVRDEREVVGAVVVRLDVERLNLLMTADGRWREAGLGDTGETYVVGRDLLLRTDARGYLEDPDDYLLRLRATGSADAAVSADAVEIAGSTVLTERVDTRPVRAALDGRTFVGRADDATGTDSLTVASPLGVDGLDWVVVAEISRSEAMDESSRQLRVLLVLAAVFLPLVALAGALLAWYLVRPVGPLVAATERIARGDLGTDLGTDDDTHDDLDVSSRDEFGHLALELTEYARAMRAQADELDEERRALDRLLAAVLPARAVDAVRTGAAELGDLVDTATVVTLTIVDHGGPAGSPGGHDETTAEHHHDLAAELERLAGRHHAERIWASADRHVYLTGLGRPDHGHDDAVRFALAARALAEHTADASVHLGVAAGTVATGVVGGGQLAFGVWGEPVRVALVLDAVGRPGEVLVERQMVDQLRIDVDIVDERRVDLGADDIEAVALGPA